MNLFKSGTFTWSQIAVLKLAVVCIGIAIGAHWHTIFQPHAMLLLVVGVVLGIYLAFIWYK